MINQLSFRRMLYAGIGLVAVVAVILAILVIPPSTIPGRAITPIWIMVIVHLLIIIVFIWTINVNQRGGRINKGLLVITGVVLIVLSLLLLDGALAYLGNPDQKGVSFWMFIGLGFDFAAGLLALIGRYFRERRTASF